MQKIILASQSPQRKLLMKALSLPFEIKPADIDEKAIEAETQLERARLIALEKARTIAKKENNSIIIAADTFTLFDEKAYEKPESLEEAKKMLMAVSGKSGYCYSGFAYIDQENSIEFSKTVVTDFSFREFSEKEIDIYVVNNPVMTWSAGFSPAYPAGINLVNKLSGSLSSFTHGLPMELVTMKLRESGVL